MVSRLQTEKQQTVTALDAIKDNKHDQQDAIKKAQDSLRAIIAGYDNSINQLSDSIQLASKEIEREQKTQDDALKMQDANIDSLRSLGASMGESKEAAAIAKVEEEKRLASLKETHEDEQAALTR